MYIALSESITIFRQSVPNENGKIRITEFFPFMNNDMLIRMPVEGNSIHPSFIDMYSRVINYVQSGYVRLTNDKIGSDIGIDNYKKLLNELLNDLKRLFPAINIESDDPDKMYSIWVKTGIKYNITGIINVTSFMNSVAMSNLNNLWIPELDIGSTLSKYQLINTIRGFVPELNTSVLMCDALYDYVKNNIMGNDPTIFFDSIYSAASMSQFITSIVSETLPDITRDQLVAVIEAPLNVNVIKPYYLAMQQRGLQPNIAKALLPYHNSLVKDTEMKVRTTFGLAGIDTSDISLVLPTEMYLDLNLSKETMIVSIM